MTDTEKKRLAEIRSKITIGQVIYEEEVKELRELEHKAAVEFARKMGCTLHGLKLTIKKLLYLETKGSQIRRKN